MPHIEIKCYPGRTDAQKTALARKITEDIKEIFGSPESSVSVAITDIPRENWKTEVWDTEIAPHMDTLYKKPEYSCD
ncbi:MAG: tautomerase PptA [Oscillospiraceae bacterium]|nr:tautomerase PptA [Oscillospiraceae bacterium]